MICPHCKKYFKSPGQVKGGEASRRKLSSEEAKRIVQIRELKRKNKPLAVFKKAGDS